MPIRAQDDYNRYPKSMRGTPEEALRWEQQTRDGFWGLSNEERFWSGLQPLFLERGYSLRARYLPGWTPSWAGTNIHPINFEDSWGTLMPGVIDARKADGTLVAIKWIPPQEHTRDELEVIRFLSSDGLRDDPRNHCLTLLDSFDHPTISGGVFIVTPWLLSLVSMPVKYVNDVADFMLQTFEGLAFMHANGVAHRDCTGRNIMVDATSLIPNTRWHPQHPTHTEQWEIAPEPLPRCQAAARYVFIDFGISSRCSPGELVVGEIGRDHTAPELSATIPYDPFMLDIYLLGNFFWTDYVSKFRNLEFLRPVVEPMIRKDPRERPTIGEALSHLKEVARKPRGPSFRWRLRPLSESRSTRVFEDTCCVLRELYYWTRVPFRGLRELRFGRP